MSSLLARLLRAFLATHACFSVLGFASLEAQEASLVFKNVFPTKDPGLASGWKSVDAFPNLTFTDPLWITEVPGSGERLVLVKGGQIWRFPNDPSVTPAQRSLVLDISGRLQVTYEFGLLRMVFHPNFGQTGSPGSNDVFLCYSHKPPNTVASNHDSMWRISRFQWEPDSGTIDPDSEEILIQQYDLHGVHNAGILTFDNDGFLLISCGDGGLSNNMPLLAQKLDVGFFGGVLRIDVDNDPARSHPIRRQPQDPAGKPAGYPSSFSQGYGIPNDNPWQDSGGGMLEEFFALGLRSPHSGHYDPSTGDFWVADVGDYSVEELNLVTKGGNYGWPFLEGDLTGPVPRPEPAIGSVTAPVFSYGRSRGYGSCIIGGLRYRGAKWSRELGGKILVGDFTQPALTAVTPNPPALPQIAQVLPSIGGPIHGGLVNICTDSAGEIYLLMNGTKGGKIFKLDATAINPQPPRFLSQTTLFKDLATLEPAEGVVPYTIASPLWSDGAEKKRWIASSTISLSPGGNLSLPGRTVMVKHFEIPVDARNPSVVRKLETRVLVATQTGTQRGHYGVTYKWNEAGTDAELLHTGVEEEFPVIQGDGSARLQRWSYPSRADCMRCHTSETGMALGFQTHQINLTMPHPESGEPVNQISWLHEKGVLNSPGDPESYLRGASLEDESMPLEHRVRSYLDSNCAHCHRTDGGAQFFDARLTTPLAGQNLIDAPLTGHFGMDPEARYIKPGNALLSALHVRGSSATPGIAMPPLGKHVVDQRAMDLLKEYIESLAPGEFSTQPSPSARYFRLTATTGTQAAITELTILDGQGLAIPYNTLSIAGISSGDPYRAGKAIDGSIDGSRDFCWLSEAGPAPHFLTVDLGVVREIGGFLYTGHYSAWITDFEIQLSQNGTDWTSWQRGRFPGNSQTLRYDQLHHPGRARVNLLGPAEARGAFPATVIFDRSMSDLSADDFIVEGGSVLGIKGHGYFFNVIIVPDTPGMESTVKVTLPENAVSTSGHGSQGGSITVKCFDSVPPYGTFGETTPSPDGIYTVNLTFSEPVTGLEPRDLKLGNGRVLSLTGSGTNYVVTLMADRQGQISAEFTAGAFHDFNGLPNLQSEPVYLGDPIWYQHDADFSNVVTWAGFESYGLNDGVFVWDVRNGDISPSPDYKIALRFTAPHSGIYIFQAETRSHDENSNSFYIGVDGGTPAVWNTNRGPGELGSDEFHLDVAGEPSEYHYNLTAGAHTVEIYGREPFTTFRRPQLVPVNPLPRWHGQYSTQYDAPFHAHLTFSRPVTGLEIADFNISGGAITSLEGGGRDYQLTIMPTGREILVNLPADRAYHGELPNLAAREWRYLLASRYEEWAGYQALNEGPGGELADDDGDGLPQLIEYAFGMNPKETSVKGERLPKLEITREEGEPRLALRFWRLREPAGIRYVPQFSDDAVNWIDATNPAMVVRPEFDWEEVMVTDHGDGGRRFGRVKVETTIPR